jgi:hypothetical protein
MLTITVGPKDLYDETKDLFWTSPEVKITLEHSLVSLSKWESKFCKPFLTKREDKSRNETLDYIRAMTLTQNVPDNVYNLLSQKNLDDISEYIDAPMTATTFPNQKKSGGKEVVTSELIYFWMISFNIPFECQKWHLNRLLTLINVCNVKNQPKKKLSRAEQLRQNQSLNAARRAQLNSKG